MVDKCNTCIGFVYVNVYYLLEGDLNVFLKLRGLSFKQEYFY